MNGATARVVGACLNASADEIIKPMMSAAATGAGTGSFIVNIRFQKGTRADSSATGI